MEQAPAQSNTEQQNDQEKIEKARAALECLNDENFTNQVLQYPALTSLLATGTKESSAPLDSTACWAFSTLGSPALGNAYLLALHHSNRLPHTNIRHLSGDLNEKEKELFLASHRLNIEISRDSGPIENEMEKNPEDLAVIKRAEENVNQLRSRYELPSLTIALESVRVLTQMPDDQGGRSGSHNPYLEETQVEKKIQKKAGYFNMIQHELIHAGGYQALQAIKQDGAYTMAEGRSGIAMSSNFKKGLETGKYAKFLVPLNEAITEENARRFTVTIPEDDPELGHIARQRREEYEKHIQRAASGKERFTTPQEEFLEDVEIDGKHVWASSSYPAERRGMWKLFDKIYETAPERFQDKTREQAREEIFDEVTKAAMTGNLLPFGRLMDRTFGKETFRNYGHLQTAEEVEQFVDSLSSREESPSKTTESRKILRPTI